METVFNPHLHLDGPIHRRRGEPLVAPKDLALVPGCWRSCPLPMLLEARISVSHFCRSNFHGVCPLLQSQRESCLSSIASPLACNSLTEEVNSSPALRSTGISMSPSSSNFNPVCCRLCRHPLPRLTPHGRLRRRGKAATRRICRHFCRLRGEERALWRVALRPRAKIAARPTPRRS